MRDSRLFTTYKKIVIPSARHGFVGTGAGECACLRKLYLKCLEAAVVQWYNRPGSIRILVVRGAWDCCFC